jgi:hypothetical protein
MNITMLGIIVRTTKKSTEVMFSRAISRVKWLSREQTNVSKTIFVLVLDQYPENEDRNGLRNVGFFTAQPFDPADSPRELHHIKSPGKQQISNYRNFAGALKGERVAYLETCVSHKRMS